MAAAFQLDVLAASVPFFQGQGLHWNHFAAFVCLIAAVYFVFMK